MFFLLLLVLRSHYVHVDDSLNLLCRVVLLKIVYYRIKCLSLFSCLIAVELCVLNVAVVLREGMKHFSKELQIWIGRLYTLVYIYLGFKSSIDALDRRLIMDQFCAGSDSTMQVAHYCVCFYMYCVLICIVICWNVFWLWGGYLSIGAPWFCELMV